MALCAGLWLSGLTAQVGFAQEMVAIEFRDHEPNTPDYVSRYLLHGEFLRLDYGRDGDDFVLYNRATKQILMVSHGARQVTEIAVELANEEVPDDWRVLKIVRPAMGGRELRIKLKTQECMIVRSRSGPDQESALLMDFKRALSGNQRNAWQASPVNLRESCQWLLEVADAGIEYLHGLPQQANYWDGRWRRFLNRQVSAVKPQLFEVPKDYARFRVGQSSQTARQPSASQAK